tara:strand:+ start:494 stop:688 length:195 start_codon:yes stop_codon:yes gene_type:complete
MEEELTNKLTKFIRDELSDSQINKDKLSAEYRLGKNEAYSNVLSIITRELHAKKELINKYILTK